MIPEWKLEVMAEAIFKKFWSNKDDALKIALQLLEENLNTEFKDYSKEIANIQTKLNKNNSRMDNLIEMRMDNEISKEIFEDKKNVLLSERENLIKLLEDYKTDSTEPNSTIEDRLKTLKIALYSDLNIKDDKIPIEIIEALVESILVENQCFVWKLNLLDIPINLKIDGNRKNHVLVECPSDVNGSTGSHWQRRKIKNSNYIYLHELVITREDVKEYFKHQSKYKKANKFEDIHCKIYI